MVSSNNTSIRTLLLHLLLLTTLLLLPSFLLNTTEARAIGVSAELQDDSGRKTTQPERRALKGGGRGGGRSGGSSGGRTPELPYQGRQAAPPTLTVAQQLRHPLTAPWPSRFSPLFSWLPLLPPYRIYASLAL
uniref:Transmembrane protein n=1 Tax=Ananas comosus var. bracteatus TaxID=296719 RepID=A0A6V7QXQ3_ANACO